jgi:hypothetical protein
MLPIMRRVVASVMTVMIVTSCTPEPQQSSPRPVVAFTLDMAESVFAKVVTGVRTHGVADFCSTFARSEGTCDSLLKEALKMCLLPGDKPVVERSAHWPAGNGSEETWQLVVQGRTLDGQKYVSDFPVVLSSGVPKAALGIYWTGQGYGQNMDDPPKYTVIPQNACPR